jgi:signal transduction histidine kinase
MRLPLFRGVYPAKRLWHYKALKKLDFPSRRICNGTKDSPLVEHFLSCRFRIICILLLAAMTAYCQENSEVLTNAADVISLAPNRAALSLPVSVKGVVTAADPALKGRFFIQDATGGVFVDNANGDRPNPGDVLEVTGITHPGAYAPIITAPKLRRIGTAPLPAARQVSIERLISGAEDSQRIETSGVVRDARRDGERLAVDLVSGGYRFRAYLPIDANLNPRQLIAAEVRVRGTAAESHNRSLRHFIAPEIYVPASTDFVVDNPERVNPFEEPLIPLNSVAQYRRDTPVNQRVHVQGVLTLQRLGEGLFLQDGTGGLRIQSRELEVFEPGEIIDAVGFAGIENYLPVLEDAVFQRTGRPSVVVRPTPTTTAEILGGLDHASFVSLTGKVMDRTVRLVRSQPTSPARTRVTLVLQNSNVLFTAESDEGTGQDRLALIPFGSLVEVSGVCLTEINSEGSVDSFRILLSGPKDVLILQQPSWLTPKRLLIGLALAVLVLILTASWSVMVSKRNSVLKNLVREKEETQAELQRAHDELEFRVKERTEQLKFQITARKEAQLQFKAVLNERTRLAQELHDTLEQTLTGIALQMDAASKILGQKTSDADRFLELARNMVAQGQVEVRRSVWDLRSRALEQFDLPGALRTSANDLTNDTSVQVTVETKGMVRPLPDIVEDNLLRIAQESLTNVIKHSGAATATIRLDYGSDAVHLRINDDGKGFLVRQCPGPDEGHFGLLGIRERVTRLQGELSIISTPGGGTVVQVRIPLTSEWQTVDPETNNEAEMT